MRDDAVSFKLPENELGEIQAMVDMGGVMEVYSEKSTFKMMSADSLDPERKNMKTPWIFTKTSNYGSSNPLIANTVLLANEFLNRIYSTQETKRHEIIKKVSEIRNILLDIFQSIESYNTELKSEIDKFNLNINLMNGKAHAYFPQIKNLDGFATSLLIAAKRCIQETSVLVNMFIYLKKKHSRIDHLLKEVELEHPYAKNLINVLNDRLPTCAHIFSLRNAQEHAATTDYPLIIENFTIENGCNLSFPKWNIKNSTSKCIHTEADFIINFLITFFEEVFITSIMLNFPSTPKYEVFFIESPDEKKPIRYDLQINLPNNLNFI